MDGDQSLTQDSKSSCFALLIGALRLLPPYKEDITVQHRKQLVETFIKLLLHLIAKDKQDSYLLVRLIDAITLCVSELKDETLGYAQQIFSLIVKIKDIKTNRDMVQSALAFVHNLAMTFSESPARSAAAVQEVFSFVLTFTDSAQYSYCEVILASRVLMEWFSKCSFFLRQQLIQACLPVLYHHMINNKCTIAETAIDYVRCINKKNCQNIICY